MFQKLILAGVLGCGSLMVSVPKADALIAPGFGRTFRVEYRQPQWQEQTFLNHFSALQFANFKRAQGFQVDIDRHFTHLHVRYRTNRWQLYQVVYSPRQANELERRLEDRGFDARVVR